MIFDLSGVFIPRSLAVIVADLYNRLLYFGLYGETVGAGSTFVEVSGKQMANMELMMPTTMEGQVPLIRAKDWKMK